MTSSLLPSASEQVKQQAIHELLTRTVHDLDHYVLLIGAILIAAGAIFTDNIPTLIASMLISPLATPILALGLGLTAGNWRLVKRAFVLLAVSCVVTIGLSVLLTVLFGNDRVVNRYISLTCDRFTAIAVAVTSVAMAG